MKKKLFKLSLFATLLLVVFIIVFVVVNLFDAPEPEGVYTIKDLIPASLKPDNGYYLLMALSYPTDMDITSPKVAMEIRKFSEPELLSVGSKEIHQLAKKHNDLYKKLKTPEIYMAIVVLTIFMVYSLTGQPFDYTTLQWYLRFSSSLTMLATTGATPPSCAWPKASRNP